MKKLMCVILAALMLAAISLWLAPPLLVALPLVALIAGYWHRRLGGISGDCLGASIEAMETLLLSALVLAAVVVPLAPWLGGPLAG